MSRIATFFIQNSNNSTDDDEIEFFNSNIPEMYKIVFSPSDCKNSYSFFMNRDRAMEYTANVLRSLASDVQPFHYIQVASHIAPSVLYNVGDLADREIRREILDCILYALEAHPTKNETT